MCGYCKSHRHVMFNQRTEFKYWPRLLRSLSHLCPWENEWGACLLLLAMGQLAMKNGWQLSTRPRLNLKWSIASTSRLELLSSLDRVQNLLPGLVDDELLSTLLLLLDGPNIARFLLLYRYAHGKCSEDPHSLVPRVQTMTARTRYTTSKRSNRLHSLSYSIPENR